MILSWFWLLTSTIVFFPGKNEEVANATNKYHEFIKNIHSQGYFNGNVLISEGGVIAYQGSFGVSNINPIDSLQLDSKFRLASVSKQFTAMGIIKLKESGLLNYDQEIKDFIPEIPYSGITIRQLLNHTSGLPDYVSLMNENWKPDLESYDPERLISGNQDIIDMLVRMKPSIRFKPGEKWEYSNTGYVLLATLVQRVSGKPFEDYLREQVFLPAGMMNTSVYNYVPGHDGNMTSRVYGFRLDSVNGFISTDAHFLNKAQGDGGIYSTLEDLFNWDRILCTNELISGESRTEAFTPGKLNNGDETEYGFGWFVDKNSKGQTVVFHAGGWVGFQTYIYRDLEKQDCIIILSNHSSIYLERIFFALKKILNEGP